MKFRIDRKITKGQVWYYPQKRFLWWFNNMGVRYKSAEEARDYIGTDAPLTGRIPKIKIV